MVIEHAFGLDEAKNHIAEDGHLFYVDDMSKEEILEQMLHEIRMG